MQYIALDAHKQYTWARVELPDGTVVWEKRIPHERGAIRRFLASCEPGSPVAVETIGSWYWIVDEVEEAGFLPQLVHAHKAKLMLGQVSKTDRLDARGLIRLQRTGTLPTVWIPSRELRDLRDLPRTRMLLVRQRTQLKNRIHATCAKYTLVIPCTDVFGKRGREILLQKLQELSAYRLHHDVPPVLAFCTAARGEELVREAFGERVVWIPYTRPGFSLAKTVAAAVRSAPGAQAAFLAKHGLVTWGDDARMCYENTIGIIEEAERWIADRRRGRIVLGSPWIRAVPPRAAPGAFCPDPPGGTRRGGAKTAHGPAHRRLRGSAGVCRQLGGKAPQPNWFGMPRPPRPHETSSALCGFRSRSGDRGSSHLQDPRRVRVLCPGVHALYRVPQAPGGSVAKGSRRPRTGYFLVSREAVRIMKVQGLGGSIVFVVSKNALVASKQASAYNAAKGAELHLARTIAEEGGPFGIRVNAVCPDAVIQGSKIWTSQWREERAKAYGIRPEEIEEYYRQRTTLKVNVFPQDVAEAVLFFASDRSSKTTGGVLTVDGGVPAAYVR